MGTAGLVEPSHVLLCYVLKYGNPGGAEHQLSLHEQLTSPPVCTHAKQAHQTLLRWKENLKRLCQLKEDLDRLPAGLAFDPRDIHARNRPQYVFIIL